MQEEVRKIVKEEYQNIKGIKDEASRVEEQTREELKGSEEKAEQEGKIRKMANYLSRLEEIGSEIKK